MSGHAEAPRQRAELLRALGVLAEPPGEGRRKLAGLVGLPVPAGDEWTEAFVVQLVPHAAVYLGPEGMLGGGAADRVAGFWRALRMPVPADADHLAALLGLYATLAETHLGEPPGARRALYRQARAALLHEHLLSWLPPYLSAMREIGPPSYVEWSRLLDQVLRAEVADIGVPERLPAHYRAVPALSRPGDGLDEVLRALLSPARSGLVLTRGHLAAVARDAGLGLRMGDRTRMLRALLEQDPHAALTALADTAEGWAARHRDDEPVTGPIAVWWARRATGTATILRAAARAGATMSVEVHEAASGA